MVPARFHSLRDRTLAAVDATFAEPVRISPMKGGASDPARPQVAIEALLRAGGDQFASGSGAMTRLAAGKAELHIDRAKYPDLKTQSGDRVRALARQGEPLFEVLAVEARGATRLVLQLNEA